MSLHLPLHMRATLGGLRVAGDGFSALFHHAHRIGLAPSNRRVRVVSNVRYGADPRQRVDVYLPVGKRQSATLPTLVFVHGGGWIACNRTMTAPLARTLAARGFAVVTPGYRLLPQCDREAQRADVQGAMAWLLGPGAARFRFDLSRIVVGGESAGAHLMMRTVQDWDASWPKPRGIVGVYGMYDVHHLSDRPPAMFEPVRAAIVQGHTFEDAAREHSALRPLPWSDVPVLLLHGEDDDIAPVRQSQAMHAMLERHGHHVRLRTYEGASHGFIYDGHPKRRATAARAYRAMLRFLLEVTQRPSEHRSLAPASGHAAEVLPDATGAGRAGGVG